MTTETNTQASSPASGALPSGPMGEMHGTSFFGLAFRVLLVAGICLNLLYLTRSLGVRVDLTQEKLYSLSPSTKRILARLEKPLVIESYFSKDLPGQLAQERGKIEDLLDEYVQMSKNLLKVVYLDPTSDRSIEDRARRLGVQPQPVQVSKSGMFTMQEVWQGLRIRYGGDRQKVIPLVPQSLSLEELLTPVIYELVLERKPKVGFIARPNTQPRQQFQQQAPPPAPGWEMVQGMIRGRYDVVPIDLSKGQQLPEDLEVLVLIEPKNMSDWEKYCIDQHIMRGGNVLLFADAADYGFNPYQPFQRQPFQVDLQGSKLAWKQQLQGYGVDWGQHVVAEMLTPELQGEADSFLFGPDGRPNNIERKPMPYWVKVLKKDWSTWASRLTKDPTAMAKLAKELTWGVDPSNPVFGQSQMLSFYWPTDVSLTKELPKGITGETFLRTSPKGVAQLPPQSSSPQSANVANSLQLRQLANSESSQVSLGVQVKGLFPSAFAGMKRPDRPGQDKTGQDKNGGLLVPQDADKPVADPSEASKADASKTETAEQGKETVKDGVQGDAEGPVFEGAPQPKEDKPEDKLPPKLDKAEKQARILVIGDANFIRDDHLSGRFPQWMSQPLMRGMVESLFSRQGRPLFDNLLDWMALDLDLIELRARRNVDRSLDFVGEVSPDEDQDLLKARVATKKWWIQWSNILLPVLALLGFGLLLLMKRMAEKRAFLSSAKATG